MKKSLLTLAGISLISVGLSATTLSNDVHAAKVTAGKIAKVTHTAYVYNSKGKRVKKTSLKKNKTTKVITIVKIKGKNYAQIGKNQFVKLSNLSGISSKGKKKVNKTKASKTNYKKIWKEKLKGLEGSDVADDYVYNVKVTAQKDTTIKFRYGYAWTDVTWGIATGYINFPKGSSVYLSEFSFKEDGKWLEVTEKDESGHPLGFWINVNDVSFSDWNNSADDENGAEYTDLDGLVPQTGAYKHQTYNPVNAGDDNTLGIERELTNRGILKSINYDSKSTEMKKIVQESDSQYAKDNKATVKYINNHLEDYM